MGDEIDKNKKNLFTNAMKGQWHEVITICKTCPSIRKTKITKSGGTALHVAVSDGQEKVVEELVEVIKANNEIEVLELGDEGGNTPLHVAAMLGNLKMCKCIAKVKPSLIGVRNRDSETPFFLAAQHGHKHVFLCLHSICGTEYGYTCCRRKDGDTILHCAIYGSNFDLAFQIIQKYENLVNYVNEQGLSPLHVLAAQPSAFRSGSHLGRCIQFIYHFIFVDELQEETYHERPSLEKDKKKIRYPENYKTCINIIKLIKKAIKVVSTRGSTEKEGKERPSDAENPEGSQVLATPAGEQGKQARAIGAAQGHQLFPPNCGVCFEFVKIVSKAMLIILGFGSTHIRKIREKKENHQRSVQVMNELLQRAIMYVYEYEDDGRKPMLEQSLAENETGPFAIDDENKQPLLPITDVHNPDQQMKKTTTNEVNNATNAKDNNKGGKKEGNTEMEKRETPILIAAKNGITEIVEKILELFPVAIHDMNSDKKNVVLLAVENRQPHVYQLLLKRTIMKDSVFRKVDNKGNSALHLAATLGNHKPWLIPGAALQMQWEIKWYEFVKESMPFHFFVRYNNENKSPKVVFTETHTKLVEAGGDWLTSTSESCSVVAALIATVAFATSATVPGGVNAESGTPTLKNQPAFNVFAISSLVALCFSVTAVVMFLSILTSRYQERDFGKDLPRKLLLGLTSLFVSIASMLISFCAGHFFVLKDKLKFAALPVYAVTCLPVTFFAIAQFPLYFDLIWATFKKVPQRSYKSIPM